MAHSRIYTASEARRNFSDVFDQAHHVGPVFVTKGKNKKVAVVSVEYLRMLTDLEAKFDADKARAALEEFLKEGGTTMKQMKEELGL